jgi:hypothetical protein
MMVPIQLEDTILITCHQRHLAWYNGRLQAVNIGHIVVEENRKPDLSANDAKARYDLCETAAKP